MSPPIHSESDNVSEVIAADIPAHVVASITTRVIDETERLIEGVFAEPIGFFVPGSGEQRRRRSSSRPHRAPVVSDDLVAECITSNAVLEISSIPPARRTYDPDRTSAASLLAIPVRAPDGRAMAAAYVTREEEHEWSVDEVSIVRSAVRIAEADARLRISSHLVEQRELSTVVLAELGAELASLRRLGDFGPAIREAAQMIARPDATAVLEMHDDRVRLIAHSGIDEQLAAALAAMDVGDAGPVGNVLTDCRPAFYASRSELLEQFPQLAGIITRSLFHSWAVVPIKAEDRSLGAIVCYWFLPRDPREMKRNALEEVGRIGGLALGRLRNQETERLLAHIEAQLSASPTVDHVISVVTDEVLHLLNAFTIHLGLLDGARLTELSSSGETIAAGEYDNVELPERPLAQSPVRRGEAVYLTPRSDWSSFPNLDLARQTTGAAAILCQPVVESGKVIGLLSAAYLDERDCGPYERNRASLVSAMIGRAIHRASLLDREREITHELQRSFLPEALPQIPGHHIVVRYLGAEVGLEVGGDWFDCFVLADGRLVIALGDIVGHGLRAAGATSQLRSACRALADLSDGPADLVERLDLFSLHARNARFATLFYAHLDVEDGSMIFCRAGHLPPVIARRDGSVERLQENGSWVIGLETDSSRTEGSATIGVGDRVIIFTDGLVERRGEDIDVGYERLERALERHRALSTDELADALVRELADRRGADDRCLMIVERT